MSKEDLVRILIAHQHLYDRDCGEDYGCTCDVTEDYTTVEFTHEEHLADVISTQYLGVTPV